MGRCKRSGTSAGLFRSVHRHCWKQICEESLIGNVISIATDGMEISVNEAKKRLSADLSEFVVASLAAERAFGWVIDQTGISVPRDILATAEAWNLAIDQALNDRFLTGPEEHNFKIIHTALGLNGAYEVTDWGMERLAKMAIIRELVERRLPTQRESWMGSSFNFQRSEQLIWAFGDVDYYEERPRRRYKKTSRKAKVRIARGVYYVRTDEIKRKQIETKKTVHVDSGEMAISTRHLYFAGPKRGFRIPFDDIIAIRPYCDGISILRDTEEATPQRFGTGDGWFAYNLLANACNLQWSESSDA